MEIEQLCGEKGEDTEALTPSSYQNLDSLLFENISFGYDRDIVLENADLEIKKGDFAVISGISGIGKSTLLTGLLTTVADLSSLMFRRAILCYTAHYGKP